MQHLSPRFERRTLAQQQALIVGLGGLGCPAAIALARAGIGRLHVCDDDEVDESNLHRQIVYTPLDVGQDKLSVAKARLEALGPCEVVLHRTRFLPENAQDLVQGMDVVLEGADNFATKFLSADACYLNGVPLVQGAAVRFLGTVFARADESQACYRCIFEDLLPADQSPNCESAGVMGPVVGVVGALMADLAFDILAGDPSRCGQVFSFDGKKLVLRTVAIEPRSACRLCGKESTEPIRTVSRALYGASAAPINNISGFTHPQCI